MGGVAVFDASLRDAGEARPSRFFEHQYSLQRLGDAKHDEVSASKTPAHTKLPSISAQRDEALDRTASLGRGTVPKRRRKGHNYISKNEFLEGTLVLSVAIFWAVEYSTCGYTTGQLGSTGIQYQQGRHSKRSVL